MSYLRPHELEIVATASGGTLAVSLSQALTVRPRTRIEFKRLDDGSYVDMEMARSDYTVLRDKLGLENRQPCLSEAQTSDPIYCPNPQRASRADRPRGHDLNNLCNS